MAVPDVVRMHAPKLFDLARSFLADRFAEARFDPDGALRITIIDPSDHDHVAINAAAEQLGIGPWLRLERAEPSALEAWERLRHDLHRLRDARPPVLMQYPMPDPGYRRPPVEIHVSADAEATAANLHAAYGSFVKIVVGALPYPLTADTSNRSGWTGRDGQQTTVDPSELHLALDGHLSIRTGQVVTHGLLVTNLTGRDITIHTNGHLTASVVNDSGATVGGYSGGQQQPLVTFPAAPSKTVRVPLLVGTASFVPDLGYAVPPGTWLLTARLDLSDGRQLTTPTFEFTITD